MDNNEGVEEKENAGKVVPEAEIGEKVVENIKETGRLVKDGADLVKNAYSQNWVGVVKDAFKILTNKTFLKILLGIIIIVAVLILSVLTIFDKAGETVQSVFSSDKDFYTVDSEGVIQITDEQILEVIESIENLGIDLNDLNLVGDIDSNDPDFEKAQFEAKKKYIKKFLEAQAQTQTLYTNPNWITENILNGNKAYGTVYVYRASDAEVIDKDNKGTALTYIKYSSEGNEESMESIVASGNEDKAKKYFSVNSSGQLVIPAWTITKGKASISLRTIDYKNIISQYTTPVNFFIYLAMTTQNPEFVSAVADLVKESEIRITVLDTVSHETETTTNRYTENKKGSAASYFHGEATINPITPTSTNKEDTTTIKTTIINPTIKVTYVKTWFCEQSITYNKENQETYHEEQFYNKNNDSSLADEKEPNAKNGEIVTWKTYRSRKVTNDRTGTTYVQGVKSDVIDKTGEKRDGDKSFIGLLDKQFKIPKTKEKTNAGPDLVTNAEWLLYLLEKDSSLQNLEQIMRYILYKYTGRDYGVTEFDFNVFGIKDFNEIGLNGQAIVEWLRSFENNWLREYRNETATQGTIRLVEERQYARRNSSTGEVEYGLDELNVSYDHSLNYSYGLRIYDYPSKTIAQDKLTYFAAEGIDLRQKVRERLSGSDRGWVNADVVDDIQVKMINDTKDDINEYYLKRGVELTSYELDAFLAISYGHGNCNASSDSLTLLKGYKSGSVSKEQLIRGFHTGTKFYPFTYRDWGRLEQLKQLFFEGRYILSTGEEIFPSLFDNWDGEIFEGTDFVFPIYSQFDEKWSNVKFGGPNGKPTVPANKGVQKTIGTSGCGTCALASIVSGFTGSPYTPDKLVHILDEVYPSGNYYLSGVGSDYFYFQDNNRLITKYFKCKARSGNVTDAEKGLKNGECVLLGIERVDGSGHVIAAVPVSSSQASNKKLFKIIDPNGAGKGYDNPACQGLYESIADLKRKNSNIESILIAAIINKGSNTSHSSFNSNGITTNEKASELEKYYSEKILHVPGTFSNKPSYNSDWNVYNNLPTEFKKISRAPYGSGNLQMFQCTWWANGRANIYLAKNGKDIKSYPTLDGDGGQYYSINKANGWFNYGSTPRVNSIGCYSNGGYGHVFYVEGVTKDGIYVSHCGSGKNWYGVEFWSNATWKSKGIPGFIYLDSPKK